MIRSIRIVKRLRALDAADPESSIIDLNNVFNTMNINIEKLKAVTKLQKIYLRSLEPVNDLRLKVELEDPSRFLKFEKEVLIDCGATDCFIDEKLIEEKELPIQKLERPIPVYQSDGEKTSARDITGYVDLRMRIRQHKESLRFYVTKLGKKEIFLSYTWLIKHNPKINWVSKRVELTQCPMSECGPVERHENAKRPLGPVSPERAPMDPMVSMAEQGVWTPHNLQMVVREEVGDDKVIYSLTQEAESTMPKDIRQLLIRATQMKATEIAVEEAKKRKSKSFEEMVLEWLHDYREVFEVEQFNELPPRRQWDHVIELKEGTGPWSGVRVIPLSSKEHQILQEFLDENLKTGRIQPSKSPFASLFFFTLKKDGKLRPVQDY